MWRRSVSKVLRVKIELFTSVCVYVCVCVCVMAWGRGVFANVFPIAGRGVCFKCVCVLSMYLLLQSDRGRERRTDRGRERPSEKY